MESVTVSLVKYARHTPDYDQATWVSAWGIASGIINLQLVGGTIRKYTLDEAQAVMDGSKATGWPFCAYYPTKQQAWDSPKFLEAFELYNSAIYGGKRVEHFDTIFLKHEMRPLFKCVKGNARTVFCQDVVSATWGVQHGKMFDQRIISNVYDAIMGNCAIVVGMTPFTNTFQILTEKFRDCVCFELDGKSWDTNMFPAVHRENAKIRCKAYGYDEQTTRAVFAYYEQVAHTTSVMPNGRLYYRFSGNPSGQANTTIDNSMWTLAAFIYTLIRVLSVFDITLTRAWFDQYVRCIVFGDDIIFGIKEIVFKSNKIDPSDLIEKFQMIANLELGLTYTSSVPSPLTDLNWLNYSWSYNRGRWWPILDSVKILNSLHIVSIQRDAKSTLERVISIRNIAYGNPLLFQYIDSYMNWLTSKYGFFNLKSSILTATNLHDLFTGAEVLHREFDWEFYADPITA